MKSSINLLPKSKVELTLEETTENIAKYRKKAIAKLRKSVKIPGFRPGVEIPEDILIKHVGSDRIENEMIDEALQKMYTSALQEHNIRPLARGELVKVISQDPLKVIMHVEVIPTVTLKDGYRKITLPKTTTEVSDAEVDAALQDIQTRFTRYEKTDTDYVVQMGDKVTIDTTGYDSKGNELDGTQMESYPLVVGSGIMVPGFEDGLVGKQLGEFELPVTFPKDYHNEDFAGMKTKFVITITQIEKAIVPEFTPEFIKDLRGKDLDLNGFREVIRQEIYDEKDNNVRAKEEQELIAELLPYTDLDVGDTILQAQTDIVYKEIKENIARSWAKVADYLEQMHISETEYLETQVQPIALKRIQAELVLHAIVEKENIQVADEEVIAEVEEIMKRYGSDEVQKRLREMYQAENAQFENLRERLKLRRAVESFFTTEKKTAKKSALKKETVEKKTTKKKAEK